MMNRINWNEIQVSAIFGLLEADFTERMSLTHSPESMLHAQPNPEDWPLSLHFLNSNHQKAAVVT